MPSTHHTGETELTDVGYLQYQKSIGNPKQLTLEEAQYYGRILKSTDPSSPEYQEAFTTLTTSCLRLVVSRAIRKMGNGVALLDLIAEGNIGLMKSAERYNPTRENKFSTYAIWWIDQSISRAIYNQSRTVRVPVHMVDSIGRMYKAIKEYNRTFGEDPTDDELADAMDIEVEKILHMKRVNQGAISLDAPVGEDGDDVLVDFFRSSGYSPYEIAAKNSRREQVIELVDATLANRPNLHRVIYERFGLGGEPPKTLEEVGIGMSLTRERIRQIQNIALRLLRRAMTSKLPRRKGLNNTGDLQSGKESGGKGPRKQGEKYVQEMSVITLSFPITNDEVLQDCREALIRDFENVFYHLQRMVIFRRKYYEEGSISYAGTQSLKRTEVRNVSFQGAVYERKSCSLYDILMHIVAYRKGDAHGSNDHERIMAEIDSLVAEFRTRFPERFSLAKSPGPDNASPIEILPVTPRSARRLLDRLVSHGLSKNRAEGLLPELVTIVENMDTDTRFPRLPIRPNSPILGVCPKQLILARFFSSGGNSPRQSEVATFLDQSPSTISRNETRIMGILLEVLQGK